VLGGEEKKLLLQQQQQQQSGENINGKLKNMQS